MHAFNKYTTFFECYVSSIVPDAADIAVGEKQTKFSPLLYVVPLPSPFHPFTTSFKNQVLLKNLTFGQRKKEIRLSNFPFMAIVFNSLKMTFLHSFNRLLYK